MTTEESDRWVGQAVRRSAESVIAGFQPVPLEIDYQLSDGSLVEIEVTVNRRKTA